MATPGESGSVRAGAASFASVVIALLVPKCPACVAAWLVAAGVSGGVATLLSPWLRPLMLGGSMAAVLGFAWSFRRITRCGATREPAERQTCCH